MIPTAEAGAGRSDDLGALLRGEAAVIGTWVVQPELRRVLQQVALIVIGAGTFGAAMGAWRSPEQALFSAVKLPCIIVGTAVGNALLNAMLAPLLGVNLGIRASLLAVLSSFALTSVVLGGCAPLMAFLVWNLPTPAAGDTTATAARNLMLLSLVGTIGFAGVTANFRLWQVLRRLGGSGRVAARLLFSWLAVNLLLGSQLSWIARPFIGHAREPVRFLSEHALEGSFFEEVLRTAGELWTHLFR